VERTSCTWPKLPYLSSEEKGTGRKMDKEDGVMVAPGGHVPYSSVLILYGKKEKGEGSRARAIFSAAAFYSFEREGKGGGGEREGTLT